jgi:hypothetical protein
MVAAIIAALSRTRKCRIKMGIPRIDQGALLLRRFNEPIACPRHGASRGFLTMTDLK